MSRVTRAYQRGGNFPSERKRARRAERRSIFVMEPPTIREGSPFGTNRLQQAVAAATLQLATVLVDQRTPAKPAHSRRYRRRR